MKVTFVKIVNIISTRKNIKLIKKISGQYHFFSTRLPYANKNIRVIYYSILKITYSSTQDIIKKSQNSEGKTKLKFYQNIFNFYDEMNIKRGSGNFQFEEDLFSKKVQSVGKLCHEKLFFFEIFTD